MSRWDEHSAIWHRANDVAPSDGPVEEPRTLDVETFIAGLDSPNHSDESRRAWIKMFFRELRAEAARPATEPLRAALKRIADWGWDQSRKPGDDPATIAEMAETALAADPATEGLDPNAMTPAEELDNFEGWADPATEGLDPHPRTYSLVGSPHLFLVTDDESGINIGYADKIGGPLVRARLSSPEDQK